MRQWKDIKRKDFLQELCFIPVLPFLSDSEKQLEETIRTVKKYAADFILIGGLTLFGKAPSDCKTFYYKFLQKHYPEFVAKYKSLCRIFFAPPKEYQKKLEKQSKRVCEKYGIKNRIT